MRAHFQPHYLFPEAIAQIGRLLQTHPVWGTLLLGGVFAVVFAIIRRVFGRADSDIIFFAVIVSVLVIVVGSACYLLLYVKGYYLGG